MKSQNEILQEEVNEFKRNKISELLPQCTKKQQAFFFVIFKPENNLIENLKEKDLDSAINLIRRTITSNN